MPDEAISAGGDRIDARDLNAAQWQQMKANPARLRLTMPCCLSPAVLKTSVNGRQFFAHLHDECTTAPETVWHLEGKEAVVEAFASLGVACDTEVAGGAGRAKWEADTLLAFEDRIIVIELQRSYQSVGEYIRRQQRYAQAGIECYWLTRRGNAKAITRVAGRMRREREWGGGLPPGQSSMWPLLADFPLSMLEMGAQPQVVHIGASISTLAAWAQALLDRRYRYDDGRWVVVDSAT